MEFASRSDYREIIARIVTHFPNIVKIPVPIERGNRLLIYPQFEELRYIVPDKEEAVKAFIQENLSKGGSFIDAGAHIGYYSVIAADIVGETGSVIAFEPHPANAERILENAALNRLDIHLEVAALGERTGFAKLSVAENSLSHRISWNQNGSTRTWSLDEYIEVTDSSPDVIKLDVEGSEVIAIPAMSKTLTTHRPAVLVEVHPWIDKREARDLYKIFQSHGYRIQTAMHNPLTLDRFLKIYHLKGRQEDHLHIFAIPKTRQAPNQ